MVGAKVIKIVFSLEFRAGTRPQDLWPFLISETGNPASPVNWAHMERPQSLSVVLPGLLGQCISDRRISGGRPDGAPTSCSSDHA